MSLIETPPEAGAAEPLGQLRDACWHLQARVQGLEQQYTAARCAEAAAASVPWSEESAESLVARALAKKSWKDDETNPLAVAFKRIDAILGACGSPHPAAREAALPCVRATRVQSLRDRYTLTSRGLRCVVVQHTWTGDAHPPSASSWAGASVSFCSLRPSLDPSLTDKVATVAWWGGGDAGNEEAEREQRAAVVLQRHARGFLTTLRMRRARFVVSAFGTMLVYER
jgi:hypothetical protein